MFNKNKIVIITIFSLVFSQVIIAGFRIHYVDIRAGYKENYISYDLSCLVKGLILAILLFPVILLFFEFQNRCFLCNCKGTDDRKPVEPIRHTIPFFLISWIIIFVFWVPHLLTFYPGGLVGDGIEVVRMALTPGLPESSHWSPLYACILKLWIHLSGRVFSDLNDCLYSYAVFESVIISGICAFLCNVLRERFPQIRFLSFVSVTMYALSGFFASYGMTFWADGVFGSLLVLFCIHLWDGVHAGTFTRLAIIRLCAEEFLICLWRNNGIYILAFVLLCMLILLKRDAIRPVLAGCSVIMIVMIITGPVYNAMGISKDSVRESISIPLQQMAAVINSGYELSSEQEEVLYSFAPENVWRDNYCPTLSDDIKFNINNEYMNEHLGSFLSVWGELMIPNFSTYVQAYLMETIGFWKLNSFQGNYWDYWHGVEDNYNYGLYERNLLKEATGISIHPYLEKTMRFISSGTVIWILLFSICSILYQGRQIKRLLVLSPLMGCWLTVMVAAPIAFAYRYVFALAMALPLVMALPFYSYKHEN